MYNLGLHRISHPAPALAEIRPNFHIRPRPPDMTPDMRSDLTIFLASDSDSDVDEILIFAYFTLTEELYDSGGQYGFMTRFGSDGNLANIIVL